MKKAFLMLLFCPLVLSAQDKTDIKSQHFTNEDGKLYWHGKNPVYIFVSDDPDGKNITRLNSQIHPQYTNPLYLDTEGINYFRTNWAADSALKQISPKTEVLFEVYRDSKAPVTTISLKNASKYKNAEGNQFYGNGLTLSTSAYDKHSGVQKTFYSIDNSPFNIYSQEVSLSDDKSYDLKVYSADNTGNVEAIQMLNFSVDATSPSSEYIVNGDRSEMIFSPRTTISLKSTDLASGVNKIVYKIDDGTERVFGNKIKLSTLKDGEHKITYYAHDNVKNIEREKTVDFYIDGVVPVVESSIEGDQYQNRGRVFISTRTKLKLTATDDKSGVKDIEYAIDGGPFKVYTEPFVVDRSTGNHVITYFAIDKVNNKITGSLDQSGLTRSTLDIDMNPPKISFKFGGRQYSSRDTSFVTRNTTLELIATDTESGVKDVGYKINDGMVQSFDKPVSFDKEGYNKIEYYATDQVNNRSSESLFFIVDNTGPEVITNISMESIGMIKLDEKQGESINVYSKGVKLFLAATDAVIDTDKIFYTVNGGTEIEYLHPIVLNQNGLVSYTIRATDKLGNETITKPKEVFIK